MSILIKGIEMPKDDEILCINIKSNGDVYYNLDLSVNTIANAIRIPPHGRLIDADGEIGVNVTVMPGGKCKVDLIAPIIIPAEKEEHDE